MRKIGKIARFLICLLLIVSVSVVIFEVGIRASAYAQKIIYRFLHRDDDSFYIYVVGGSTAYGEPYDSKISFSKIVSYMFDGTIRGKKIEIINLAEPGHNVEYAYWKLFRELFARPHRDGLLLIYAGINDPVSRGADPSFWRWKLMQRSIVLSKLQYVLEGRLPGSLFEGRQTDYNALSRFFGLNNSLQKYEYRLRKLIALAKSYGQDIVISTLVGNISQFDPEDRSIYEAGEALALFNEATERESSGDFAAAIEIYERILGTMDVNLAHVYYHLGKCYRAVGMQDQAKEYFWKAVDVGDPRRPNRWQNEVIRRLAREYDIELSDSSSIFEEDSPDEIPGDNLFVDAHHPNLRGYILMARGFAREMEKVTGERIARPDVTPEEIMEHFGFGDKDLFGVFIDRSGWFIGHATLVHDKEERLRKAEYFLQRAEEFDRDNTNIYFFHFFIALLREDREEALYWLDRGKLLSDNRDVFCCHRWMYRVFNLSESVLPQEVIAEITAIQNEQ